MLQAPGEILAGAPWRPRSRYAPGDGATARDRTRSILALRAVSAGLKLTTAKFYSPRIGPGAASSKVEFDVPVSSARKPALGDLEPGRSASGGKEPIVEFGDPVHDPVLGRAILQAKQKLNAAR